MTQDRKSEIVRCEAYTTPRPDVFQMVPSSALTILDIGCSNGALGASLRRAQVGRKVFGMEINPVFAEAAELHLDKVVCCNLNETDLDTIMSDDQFDCIIFADVLEHLQNPQDHLLRAKNRLYDGGCIIISLPNIRHISAFYSIFIKGTFPLRERGIFDSTHLRWFTIGDALKMIADAGMKVELLSYNLRLGDQGGGRLNRLINKMFSPISWFYPVREFLTYQFCIRAVVTK